MVESVVLRFESHNLSFLTLHAIHLLDQLGEVLLFLWLLLIVRISAHLLEVKPSLIPLLDVIVSTIDGDGTTLRLLLRRCLVV